MTITWKFGKNLLSMSIQMWNSVSISLTRSQAVARIADRTTSQHLWGSRDVLGHVTIWYPTGHFLLVVLWNRVSESVSPAVFEILRSKRIGVMSLTFQGNVISSVTW